MLLLHEIGSLAIEVMAMECLRFKENSCINFQGLHNKQIKNNKTHVKAKFWYGCVRQAMIREHKGTKKENQGQ